MVGGAFGMNSVDILVRVLGAQQIAGQMANIERNLNRSASRIANIAPASEASQAALAATGTAVAAAGYAALRSYSDFRRFEIGLESMVGKGAAARLAAEVREFGAASAYSNAEIMRMSQFMLAMGTPMDRLMPRMKSLANLTAMAGGNTETFSRAALAVGQIQSAGVLRGQELRQLTEAGIPVSKLAQAMGMSMKQVMDSNATIPAERFMMALEKMGLGHGDVQGRLSAEVPMIRFANLLDRIQLALMPVGNALNSMLKPVLAVADISLVLFQRFNELTLGIPTMLALVGIAYKVVQGFAGLRKSLIEATVGLTVLARTSAAAAVSQVAARAAGGTFPGLGSYGTSAGGVLAPMGAIAAQQTMNKASGSVAGKATAWLATKLGIGAAGKLGGAAVANAVPVIGQLVSLGLIAWTIYDVVTAGQEISKAMADSQAETDRSRSRPGQRPLQRSDVENMQQRMAWGY